MAALLDAIPAINVVLVEAVGILILLGLAQIREGRIKAHKRLMLSATALFALFLVLYLSRLILHGPTSFTAENPAAPGWAYTFYLAFLITHMALALVTTVLIPVVLRHAFAKRWEAHKRLARMVAPMWLVSIAMGITVYFLLFHIWS